MRHFYLCLVFLSLILMFGNFNTIAQSQIHHWETVVLAEDDWSYFVGTSEPAANWYSPLFTPNDWEVGQGGIGYGDGDDNTLISNTISLYMRHEFTIFDADAIEMAILHADYDDAFVAYLNGVEIARSNIGQAGDHIPYHQVADQYREAKMFEGGLPEAFSISKENLSTILQEGLNTLAIQVHNQSFDSSDMSSLFFLSVGITEETTLYEPTPEWFAPPVTFLSSNLPLVAIHTNGQTIQNEPRIIAQMGIIDNGPGQINYWTDDYNHYDGQISIEIRGNSSQFFDKKNYGIETQDENGENLDVPLLGMPEENDWVLHGPYSDKSLMRNDLTYHIGRAMGRYAPRTRYCELMINEDYLGVYVLIEKIKRDQNRVDIANIKPEDIEGDELTGDYLFKIDWDNGHPEDGFYSSFAPNPFYAYVEPDFDELQPEQENYIRSYIQSFEQAMNGNYFETYAEYIDVPSLVDYVISNELGKEVDSYRLSTYMYKKKDSNGGKIHFGPLWDFNLGYGNYDYCPESPEGWAYQFNTTCGSPLPFWINRLVVIPEIRNTMNCRWFELRETVLHTDTLMLYIDARAALLAEAEGRNFERWQILGQYVWPNSFIGNTYAEEINFLKTWLRQRLLWIDANIIGTCDVVATEDVPTNTAEVLRVFPNPFAQEVVFELSENIKNAEVFIYDILGREVANLSALDSDHPLTWNVLDADGKAVSHGIYTYILKKEARILAVGKMVRR